MSFLLCPTNNHMFFKFTLLNLLNSLKVIISYHIISFTTKKKYLCRISALLSYSGNNFCEPAHLQRAVVLKACTNSCWHGFYLPLSMQINLIKENTFINKVKDYLKTTYILSIHSFIYASVSP